MKLATQHSAWQLLQAHHQATIDNQISDLFMQDEQRFASFSLKFQDLLLDFSKQNIDARAIELLLKLAEQANLGTAIKGLFEGAIVNRTENRAARHTELRNPHTEQICIVEVLAQMERFVERIYSAGYTDVIAVGIGGSDLGPRLGCEALRVYANHKVRVHFIANVDGDTVASLLVSLDPTKTVCIINSKTFTTIETLAIAKVLRNWTNNFYAVTANVTQAIAFGVAAENIFPFWDWVGGRYSVWSAVGLPIALQIGMENFRQFLLGANDIDEHFKNTEFKYNLPVILGLIGIWNINFNNYLSLCVQPYSDGLRLLPEYLQQLEMESNGKRCSSNLEIVPYQTAPVIWGGVGCNSQHAFMQLLHQGTQVIPVDYLVPRNSVRGDSNLHDILLASCFGQSRALMTGCSADNLYKGCPGNRPSTTIMFDKLCPRTLGRLLALYEHKVFVQGIIWGIESFDQWGVQLGKEIIKQLLPVVAGQQEVAVDSSTAGLLASCKAVELVDND